MLIADIHHISINVSDTETSLKFYRDVLGLVPMPRPDFGFPGAWLDAGNGRQVHLIEAPVPPDLGQHTAFLVVDIDASIEQLREKGIDLPDAFAVGDTNSRQTFFLDPDNNRLELHQPF